MKAQFSSINLKDACSRKRFTVEQLPTKYAILSVRVRSLDACIDVFLKPITATYMTGFGKIATKQRIELVVLKN